MTARFTLCLGLWLGSLSLISQTASLRGTVTDAQSGDLLVGVTVGIEGSSKGAATDADGSYYLTNIAPGTVTLVARGIGYATQRRTVELGAGAQVVNDFQLGVQSTELAEVLVTGLRKSQIDAINVKRQALNNVNVLRTNDLGRLPDINVAEAAQRIPGVSIETDNGEGRFISIRGIQPSLNNVTLNGGNLGSTSGGRETPLDLLPIEMISSIEVTKANTPDMEGTGIGGAINITTISAFDRSEPEFFIGSVDGLLQDQQADYLDDKFPFRVALTGGKRFGKDQNFGAVVSANYFRRDFSVSILDPDRWVVLQGLGPDGQPTPGYLGPNEIEIQIEDNERERYGLTADLEYRPRAGSSVYLRSLYTHNDELDYNSEFELTVAGLGDQELTDQTPTSGRFSKGSGELDLSSNDINRDLYSFTLGTDNRFGDFTTELYGTYSRANQLLNGIDGTYENDREEEGLLAATYDTKPFFFDITAEDLETARDPSIYYLRSLSTRDNNTVQENLYEGTLNIRYDLKLRNDTPAYLKAGVRWRRRGKDVDRQQSRYDDDDNEELGSGGRAVDRYTLEQFSILPVIEPEQGGASPNVHGDALAFATFFNQRDGQGNRVNLQDTNRIWFQPERSAREDFEEDIYYQEDISAAYLMGVIDLPFATITAGARVERTEVLSTPWVRDNEGAWSQGRFENSYTNFLPSVHVRAKLAENFIGRLSWSNTLGRADYDQLSGASIFEAIETATPGVFTGSFEGANPDLAPLTSTNWDLNLEYYFPFGGIASIGGFYKRINDQIFELERQERNFDFRGQFFEDITFERNVNLNRAEVYGLEAAYDQALTFLPSPFDGFGITANLALIESEAEYPNREDDDLPLFRQPSSVWNLIPYYQKFGVELRAALTYRSSFLVAARSLEQSYVEDGVAAGFSISDFDRYEGSRTALDVTAAYTFPNRKFKILAQARNLTNAPEQEYQGIESRYDRHQLFGQSYFLGFSVSL